MSVAVQEVYANVGGDEVLAVSVVRGTGGSALTDGQIDTLIDTFVSTNYPQFEGSVVSWNENDEPEVCGVPIITFMWLPPIVARIERGVKRVVLYIKTGQ